MVDFLQRYNPSLAREVIYYLTPFELVALCQILFVTIPFKIKPQAALEFLKNPNLNRSSVPFHALFKECNRMDLKDVFDSSTTIGQLGKEKLSKGCLANLEGLPYPKHQREMMKTVLIILQDFTSLLEFHWQDIAKDNKVALAENTVIQSAYLPQKKQEVDKENLSGFISFGSSDNCHNVVNTLLPHLIFYTSRHLPNITHYLKHLKIESSDFSTKLAAINKMMSKCFENILKVEDVLGTELARFEGNLSLCAGIPTQSPLAYRTQLFLFIRQQTIIREELFLVGDALAKVLQNKEYKASLSQPTTVKDASTFFRQIGDLFANIGKQQRKFTAAKLKFQEEILKNIKKDLVKAYKRSVEIYLGFTKDEKAAHSTSERNFRMSGEKYSHIVSPLDSAQTYPWINIFATICEQYKKSIEELTSNWKSDSEKFFAKGDTTKSMKGSTAAKHLEENLKLNESARKSGHIRFSTTSKESDEFMIGRAAKLLSLNKTFATSSVMFKTLFSALMSIHKRMGESTNKEQAVKADAKDESHLLTELEKESAAAKKAYEDAERIQKEQQS